MKLLIHSGTIVTANETLQADILVDGERIAAIGPNLSAGESAIVIDASGKLVLPGGGRPHPLRPAHVWHRLLRRPLQRS
jgi:dihydropyrimidinase